MINHTKNFDISLKLTPFINLHTTVVKLEVPWE